MIIIYDDSCPMCAAYTKGFVSAGMIKKENRRDFTTIDPAILSRIDTRRCNNEIPVIDIQTNQVWYGIDAMLEILQTRVSFTKKLAQFKFIRWILNRLYKLISYNRRVIVAAKKTTGNFDCTPDFNYEYRLVFMLFFLVFNTVMLFPIHSHILNHSPISISAGQLQYAHFALVILNLLLAFSLKLKPAFEYLGQVICSPLPLFY
jgi:predicted DCC family thiol-disulfide oxidoreductase YuxK